MGPHVSWYNEETDDANKKYGVITGHAQHGSYNIAIGVPSIPAPVFINGGTIEQTDWMTWEQGSNKVQLKLSDEWITIDPDRLMTKHPLDLGVAIKTGSKADLTEIREQYEQHIASSPWLQKLRREYDEAAEKHKLFDAIKGDADA